MRRVPKHLTDRARAMRNDPTEAEYKLWKALSRYRPKFTRQLEAEGFIIDLACRKAKLGVELDGSQHQDTVDYDDERTSVLSKNGWTILRFWNNDVLSNTDGVAEVILAKVAECLGDTHPQPLPSREGRIRKPRFK